MSVVERSLNGFVQMFAVCMRDETYCKAVRDIRGRRDIESALGMSSGRRDAARDRSLLNLLNDMERSPALSTMRLTRALRSQIGRMGQSGTRDWMKTRELYHAIQFLNLRDIVLYEVLHADDGAQDRDKYSAKMKVAGEHVREVARAMRSTHGRAYLARARVTSPIVAGRSFLDLALEYGIAWDPVLDIPYLPASEMKGAVRSVAMRAGILEALTGTRGDVRTPAPSLMAALDVTGRGTGHPLTKDEFKLLSKSNGDLLTDDELEALLNPSLEDGQVGGIQLSDAYPVSAPNGLPLELLVLTPHYTPDVRQEYEVSPNPIKYLGIGRGTELEFAVGVSSEGWAVLDRFAAELKLNLDPKAALEKLLSDALDLGVGRRTNRGMGRMKLLSLEEVG